MSRIIYVVVFMSLLHLSITQRSCVTSIPVLNFADFAKRSPIVLRAFATKQVPRNESLDRYDVTFRIIGGFPNRHDSLSRRRFSVVSIGPFGEGENCVKIQPSTKYILFLRKRTLSNRTEYKMTFNPVPFSLVISRFFTRVLRGKISGKAVMKSGCRLPERPRNGNVQCTKDKVQCRATCKGGFHLKENQVKTCNRKTMRWNSSKNFECESKALLVSLSKPLASFINAKKITSQSRKPIIPFRRFNPPNALLLSLRSRYQDLKSSRASMPVEEDNANPSTTSNVSEATFTTKIIPVITSTARTTTKSETTSSILPNLEFQENFLLGSRDVDGLENSSKDSSSTNNSPTKTTIRYPIKSISSNLNLLFKRSKLHKESPNSISSKPNDVPEQNTTSLLESSTINSAPNMNSTKSQGPITAPLLGFGAQVVGCPIYEGTITIHSVWINGFHGTASFPNLEQPLQGWMVRLILNVPLHRLEVFTSDIIAVSRSRQEYVLIPKEYNRNIYQELTMSFNGRSNALRGGTAHVMSRGFLMGLCRSGQYDPRTTNHLLPFDDQNSNYSEAWITNRTEFSFEPQPNSNNAAAVIPNLNAGGGNFFPVATLPRISVSATVSTSPSTLAQTGRCSEASPSGSLSDGENTVPNWKRPNSNITIDYNELLHKSILFYEAQRSGSLPPDNRIPWRGDADLKDGCSIRSDLTGGWYNAGGNVKSTTLIAFSATLLAWGAIDYRDAYIDAGEMENVLKQIRWATDYLIKCHIGANQLVVQVGNYTIPSQSWEPPEDFDPSMRPVYIANENNPAADVASEVVAALAAANLFFNANNDSSYADNCLQHALELYQFAQNYRSEYGSSIRDAEWPDPENGLDDDIAWAATWLYMATRNASFLRQAEISFLNMENYKNIFYWGDKTRAVAILLAGYSRLPLVYRITTNSYLRWMMTSPHYTSNGLLWLDAVGTTMLAANSAFLAVKAGNISTNAVQKRSYYNYAQGQLERLIGRTQRGYVIGVGTNSPKRPYHRGSTCSAFSSCTSEVLTSTDPNPNILYGALVNGPGLDGSYRDQAANFVHNSVGITFNAGFQSLVAGLKQNSLKN